jgi:predicted nucleotidyltransferase
MSFTEAFKVLNGLKRRKVIRDYVVIGAVGATNYMEPVFTEDIDVVVLVDTDEEYRRTFAAIAQQTEAQDGMHQVLGGVPVQLFPSTIMPLYRDTLEGALQVRFGNLRVKFASAEHLILLYLLAFRERDHLRVRSLLLNIDEGRLQELLDRFDDEENTLAGRL